ELEPGYYRSRTRNCHIGQFEPTAASVFRSPFTTTTTTRRRRHHYPPHYHHRRHRRPPLFRRHRHHHTAEQNKARTGQARSTRGAGGYRTRRGLRGEEDDERRAGREEEGRGEHGLGVGERGLVRSGQKRKGKERADEDG
ncbi:hypothetical protein CPC08DRAFT_824724, partial [Agrocybe pediades]